MMQIVEIEIAGRTLRLETGRVAKQADGSVLASYGDTVILATAVASQTSEAGDRLSSLDGRLSREGLCRRKNSRRIF